MKIGVLYCGYVQRWKDIVLAAKDIEIIFETEELPMEWDVQVVCIFWDGHARSIERARACCEEKGVSYIVLKADLISQMRLYEGREDVMLM